MRLSTTLRFNKRELKEKHKKLKTIKCKSFVEVLKKQLDYQPVNIISFLCCSFKFSILSFVRCDLSIYVLMIYLLIYVNKN